MTIKINQETCIGCGTCLALAPASFKWNDQNKADGINPPGDDEKTVKDATAACPVQAITIE